MAELDVPAGCWERVGNGHVRVDAEVGERLWQEARARRDRRRAAARDVQDLDRVLRSMLGGDGVLLRTKRSRFVVARLDPPGRFRQFDGELLQQSTGLDPAQFMTEYAKAGALIIPRSWERAA